jgi:ribosomal protein S1
MDTNKQGLYDLLNKSINSQKKLTQYKKGDSTEATVEKIGESYIIVKIDETYNAIIPSGELIKKTHEYEIGDVIKVFVIKYEDDYGNMIVSQKRTETGQKWEMLYEAAKNNTAVIVNVTEANKGGVIVNFEGLGGFIPMNQLDPNKVYKLEGDISSKDNLQKEFSRKLTELIGTKMTVKVVEVDREKKRIIFSENLALNEQSAEVRSKILKSARIGDTFEAIIKAVTPYGIFVNADGLDGLVHVSEISWDKVGNPADYAKVGDTLRVKLIDIDEDGKRVAFSVKQLSDDPWNDVAEGYKVGGKVKGTIMDIEDYGIIVKIAEGVTGLIHKSELSDEKIGDPKDHFTLGQTVEAIILTIAPSERKMGLSIKRLNGKSEDDKPSRRLRKDGEKKRVPGSLDIAGALEKANAKKGAKVEAEPEAEEVDSEPKGEGKTEAEAE